MNCKVFINRRYDDYVNVIKETLLPLTLDIYLTDTQLRPHRECIWEWGKDISIILMCNHETDREEQHEQLARWTRDIRRNSKSVFVIMFSTDVTLDDSLYNQVDDKMKVVCIRETTDDHNIKAIQAQLNDLKMISII